jgi:hypothetical protein
MQTFKKQILANNSTKQIFKTNSCRGIQSINFQSLNFDKQPKEISFQNTNLDEEAKEANFKTQILTNNSK